MRTSYLYFVAIIVWGCSSSDESLPFATVDNISVKSTVLEQATGDPAYSISIEGIVHDNGNQVSEAYLLWNEYSFENYFVRFKPDKYVNRKKIKLDALKRFVVNDTVTTRIYLCFYIKTPNRNSYSRIYEYYGNYNTLYKLN